MDLSKKKKSYENNIKQIITSLIKQAISENVPMIFLDCFTFIFLAFKHSIYIRTVLGTDMACISLIFIKTSQPFFGLTRLCKAENCC